MKKAMTGVMLVSVLFGFPVLMGAAGAGGNASKPAEIMELVRYTRGILAEKGDEGVVALARLAKVDIYKAQGNTEAAIAELKTIASESKDREILLLAHAALLDLFKKEGQHKEAIELLDGLIARIRPGK